MFTESPQSTVKPPRWNHSQTTDCPRGADSSRLDAAVQENTNFPTPPQHRKVWKLTYARDLSLRRRVIMN